MRRYFLPFIFVLFCLGSVLHAAEVMPPRPTAYFNDYASVVSPAVADQLNNKLADFERQTSNQIVVAVYPKMQSDSSIEDYTVRVAQAWQVGQAVKKNGAVLFVFINDHKMDIQVGYGLEGALPDAICKRIIDDEIKPKFQQGDFAGGLTAGVHAMLAATKGEYKGTGQTVHDRAPQSIGGWGLAIFFIFVVLLIIFTSIRRGMAYNSYGSGGIGWQIGGALLGMLSNSGSSGSSGGGWSSGGGGGGFSSGGGSFGGGGASGSW